MSTVTAPATSASTATGACKLAALPALPKVIDPGVDEHMEIVVAYARHAARKLVREDSEYALDCRRTYVDGQNEPSAWDDLVSEATNEFMAMLKGRSISVKDGRYFEHPEDVYFDEFGQQVERSLTHTKYYRNFYKSFHRRVIRIW